MKAINSQIDFVLNDLRQAITDANKEPRQYNKKSAYQYTPEQSRFKLVVWFHDGNRRTYYSYDNVYFNKVAHIDEQEAIMKLIRLTGKYAGKFKNAQIYATIDPERKKTSNYNYLVYWVKWNGEMETNEALRFKVENQNTTAILNRLEVYSAPKYVK
jgi:hypothetical protein